MNKNLMLAVVSKTNTAAATLLVLTEVMSTEEAVSAIIEHPNATAEVLHRCAEWLVGRITGSAEIEAAPEPSTIETAVPVATPIVEVKGDDNPSASVVDEEEALQAVLKAVRTSRSSAELRKYAADDRGCVVALAARNSYAGKNTLRELALSASKLVRESVAANPGAPADVVSALTNDVSARVRRAVEGNPRYVQVVKAQNQ